MTIATILSLGETALKLGLICSLTVLALFLSYSMLNVCDLSTDGCFTFGAAVGAVVAVSGHPFLSIVAAMAAGVLSGFVTAILQTKLGVDSLLAGIIVNTALYSVNIAVMGGSSLINMNRTTTVFTMMKDTLAGTPLKGREDILKVHAKKIKVGDNVDYNKVARMASGASGAELANIVNEAALRAVRDNRKFVTQEDLEESIEVVIAGYQKKNAILTDKEKRIVAYHEIGHALVAAKQTNSAPVQKITIVPRTSGALGYTMQVEEGNHYLMTKEEILNKIATLTGGRAAEEIVFGSVTTGASNDIEQATKLARAMITRYGMTCDFDMVAMEVQTNQYLGGDSSLTCSTETQTKIDEKVVEVVRSEHEKAAGILMENREKLDDLARYLYEKETITGEEFMNILNA